MDLAIVLDSIHDGVFVCDADRRMIVANKAGLRMLGVSSMAELRSRNPGPPVTRDENGAVMPPESMPLARALRGESFVQQVELVDVEHGRRVVYRARAAPIRDGAGEIVGAVKTVTDITHEYELERVKEDFVRVAAHELKTPVTIIKANAEATLSAFRDAPEAARRLLEAMARGAERIDRLVSSLLDLLDLQGGILDFSPRPVRLEQLLTDVVGQLPAAAAARIRIEESAPIQIVADPRRLRQVTRALLDNAIKFSPPRTPIEVALTSDERMACLKIRDYGVGIPRDKRERIFEKFFSAHSGTPHDAGGIGVGLFVAREIVAQHGGRISFESAEDQGTTFRVELPLSGKAA